MGTLSLKGCKHSMEATALVVDRAEAFEKVRLSVVWKWAVYFDFPQRVPRVLCVHFAHERRVMFENHVCESMVTITAILPGSTWSVFMRFFSLFT